MIKEYQEFAAKGILPETAKREPVIAFALGLVGETGEVVDDIKKRIFHGRIIPIEHTAEELGDVMWYVANIATTLGLSLSEILLQNMTKLRVRYPDMYEGGADESKRVYERFEDNNCVAGPHKGIVVKRNGPHYASHCYECGHFIKFLNKKEKEEYGITEGGSTGSSNSGTETNGCGSEGVLGECPWD